MVQKPFFSGSEIEKIINIRLYGFHDTLLMHRAITSFLGDHYRLEVNDLSRKHARLSLVGYSSLLLTMSFELYSVHPVVQVVQLFHGNLRFVLVE